VQRTGAPGPTTEDPGRALRTLSQVMAQRNFDAALNEMLAETSENGRDAVLPDPAQFVKIRRNLHQIRTKTLLKLTPSACFEIE
jgi:hypothetical protein